MMPKTVTSQKILMVAGGIVVGIILLELMMRLAGFGYLLRQEIENRKRLKKSTFRIMCIGESTTALGGAYSYPSQLERILNRRQAKIEFKVINKGIPGTSVGVIADLLQDNIDRYQPDVVVAMIGLNDQDLEEFTSKEYTILRKGRSFWDSFKVFKLGKLILWNISDKINKIKLRGGEKKEWKSDHLFRRSFIALNGKKTERNGSKKTG